MTSKALQSLVAAVEEVKDLERANPSPVGAVPKEPRITRVIGRASIVLLCSHFERYFYAINEEACEYINSQKICGDRLPEELRLLHSKSRLDDIAQTSWENRKQKLTEFVVTDSWLWSTNAVGILEHQRLLGWMKTPKPRELVRYYRYWGIQDIFDAITRTNRTKRNLWLRIGSLVEKRNNIAHGDLATDATQQDLRLFAESVKVFCERADRKLSSQIAHLFGLTRPW